MVVWLWRVDRLSS